MYNHNPPLTGTTRECEMVARGRMEWPLALPLVIYIISLFSLGVTQSHYEYSNRLGMAVAVLYGLYWLARRSNFPPVLAWWILFGCWAITSGGLTARYFSAVTTAMITFAQILVLMAVIFVYARSLDRIRLLCWVVAISSLLPLTMRWLGFSVDLGETAENLENAGRFTGTTAQPNRLGALLVVGACASSIVFFASQRRREKVLCLVILVAVSIGIMMTGSRSALLVLCVLFAVTYCFHFMGVNIIRNIRGLLLLTLVGSFVGGYLMRAEDHLAIFTRITDTVERVRSGQDSRPFLIRDALGHFARSPVAGIGFNNYRYMNVEGGYEHNNFVMMLAGTGIVGAAMYYAPFLLWFIYTRRLTRTLFIEDSCVRRVLRQAMGAMLVILLLGMFHGSWRYKEIAIMLGLLFATPLAVQRRRSDEMPVALDRGFYD